MNCSPVITKDILTLQVLCESSDCSQIKSEWFEWSFSPPVNYNRDLLSGRYNDHVVVNENALTIDTSYKVTVRIIGFC